MWPTKARGLEWKERGSHWKKAGALRTWMPSCKCQAGLPFRQVLPAPLKTLLKGKMPFQRWFQEAWHVLPWIASHNFWLAIHDSTGGPCLRVQLKGKISSGEGTTPHCQSAVCHSGRCWWTSLESTVFRQAALGSTIEKESSLASLWMASLTWQQHLKRTFHFNHPFRWTGGSSSSSWYPQCNVIMLGVLYGGPAPSWKAPQRPVLVLHRSWILYDSIAKHTDTMMTVILMCSQGWTTIS